MDEIRKFMDKNNSVLSDKSPIQRLFFRPENEYIIYPATGLTEKDIKEFLGKNDLIGSTWKILNKPFIWAMIGAIRYFYINKNKNEFEATIIYLSLFFYSSIQYKYFHYGAKDTIMDYTINNLSNKFLIKKHGILFKALWETIINSHDKYSKLLINGDDESIRTYVSNLRNRIDSMVQNIAKQYYTNWEKKLYLNPESESFDPDDYHEIDNISLLITKASSNCSFKIITNGVDDRIADLSAKMCGVSIKAIKDAVSKIIEKNEKTIKELIELILQIYLVEEKNSQDSISTKKFISDCLTTYSKSNTSSKLINRLKEILDTWLKESSDKYTRTERAATKNSFRKAIFCYFVFSISYFYSGK
jgi:hypothetical protein